MLKRYGATIVFSVIVFVSIACFYGVFSVRSENMSSLSIKTVSGNAKELNGLTLYGQGVINNINSKLHVTNEGAIREPDTILNNRFGNRDINASEVKIAQLQKKYRSFMRGKNTLDRLYEDKTFLFYANTDDLNKQLKIEYYDKSDEKRQTFSFDLPKEYSQYKYVNIRDVQWIDQQMVIVLDGQKLNYTELFVVNISLEQKKIVDSKTLYRMKHNQGNPSYYFTMSEENLEPSSYYVFRIAKTGVNDSTQFTLYAIDLKEGRMKQIALPDKGMYEWNYYTKGNMLYFVSMDKGELFQIDLEKGSSNQIFQSNSWKNMDMKVDIKGNKVYMMYDDFGGDSVKTSVDVIDVKQKKLVYEGEVEQDQSTFRGNFSFRSIVVK